MDRTLQRLLIVMAVASQSTLIFAQNYSGSINLNASNKPPMEIQGIICDKYVGYGPEYAYKYKACSDGSSAARVMAEDYAQSAGGYLGCLDGFHQGIRDGYNLGKKLSYEEIQAIKSEMQTVTMDSAVKRAEDKAKIEVVTESADQIIKRYRAVIGKVDPATGQQMEADKTYEYPKITFLGYDNGYDYEITEGRIVGQNFDQVYGAQWVTSSDEFKRRVAAKEIWNLQDAHASEVCDNSRTIFGRREMTQVSLWDFFKARRTNYNFEKFGWSNADWTWQYFDKDERTLAHYTNYKGLENLKKEIDKEIIKVPAVTDIQRKPKRDADGNVMRDADGRVITEEVTVIITPAVYETIQIQVPLTAEEVETLRAVYREGFKESYSRYYAAEYASLAYEREGTRNYTVAKMIGNLVGQKVATHLTKQLEYDARYKTVSNNTFRDTMNLAYETSFDTLIDTFEKHAVVEFNSMGIFGAYADDGIFKASEGIGANIMVTNLGEKTETIKLRLSSNSGVNSNNSPFAFNPTPLSEAYYTSGILGTIGSGVLAREDVDVNMSLQSPVLFNDISSVLNFRQGGEIEINAEAEVAKIHSDLDLLGGTLSLTATIFNASSEQTTALPKVVIRFDGSSEVLDKEMTHLPGKGQRPVAVTLDNLDPLELIQGGSISGLVQTLQRGRVLHQKDFKASIVGSKQSNYITYFHSLANRLSDNIGNAGSRAERMSTLMNIIENSVVSSLAQGVNWRKSNQVAGTIVGELQKTYQRAQRDGNLNSQDDYDALAQSLAKLVGRKGKGKKVRGKKKFLQALAVFSPSLSTKVKSHK